MTPVSLYFNLKDIFLAPRIALSGKKIWIFVTGNLIGFMSYWIMSYVSILISGYNFLAALNDFGMYPHIYNIPSSLGSSFFYSLGLIVWISLLFISSTAVSRVTLEELSGNHLFSISNAWKFSLQHWKTSVFCHITIIFIIFTLCLIGTFIALLSSTPYIGPLTFSSLFPIIFLGSVFIIYTILVLFNSLIYTPAIISTYEEDIMGTIFQSYSISWSQPWRIIAYNIIISILILTGLEIFSWFCINGYNLISLIFGHKAFLGNIFFKITNFSFNIVFSNHVFDYILDLRSNLFNFDKNSFSVIPNIIEFKEQTMALGYDMYFICSILLSIFLFIIVLSVFSYCLSIFSVGQTISFIIFKKLSDDDDIIKRFNKDQTKSNSEDFFDKDFDDVNLIEKFDNSQTSDFK